MKVPTGEKLVFGGESFMKFEERGIKEAKHSAFVLVAGGLGERLGYSGIKVTPTLVQPSPTQRGHPKTTLMVWTDRHQQ